MGPKSMIKNNTDKVKKSTVQFLEKPSSKLHASKLHASKLHASKLHGGISVKDDPDKINKEDSEDEEYEDDDKDEEDKDEEDKEDEDKEEDEEVEEVDEVEKEEFDKEKDEDEDGVEGDDCVYRLTKKKNTIDVEIEEGEDMFEDEDDNNDNNDNNDKNNKSKYVKNSDRRTKPFLFDFERVRLLGDRARQLSLGAKPMIKNIEDMNPKVIAKLELEKKIIPLIILRDLPNGLIEKWKVSELSY